MAEKKKARVSPVVRSRARERALQFLFGLEFTNYAWQDVLERFWVLNPPKASVREYAEWLIDGVASHREELDSDIQSVVESWAPGRIGHVERNIIRLALFEMRYGEDVPAGVAINEAIELAKRFGSDEAPRFINGVLDRLKGD